MCALRRALDAIESRRASRLNMPRRKSLPQKRKCHSGLTQPFPVTPSWFEAVFELGGLGEPYCCNY
jgi:hypothetical protein